MDSGSWRLGFRDEDDFKQSRFIVAEAVEPGGAIRQRCNGAQERGYLNGAPGDALQAGRVFTTGGTGTQQGEFARDDGLERQFHRGGQDCPPE